MCDRLEELHKNPMSDLLIKEESSAGSISSENKVEVCLMTKGESESSQVSTTSSNKCESYFQLFDAFQEIHEEAKRLTFLTNRLKCENNKLKMKITVLEKDLNQSKTYLENSDLLHEKSFCKCDSNFCKNCESLQEKVLYLVKTIDVISKGKSNFENVLASQTCVFWKIWLGF